MLQIERSQVRVPIRSLNIFNLPNPSNRTMASNKNEYQYMYLGGKARPERNADNPLPLYSLLQGELHFTPSPSVL
jgi:hypothetical protein